MAKSKGDKFILKRPQLAYSSSERNVVRISSKAYNYLVDMANESTLSLASITSQAIEFAFEHLEFETVNEKGEEDGTD